MVLRPGIRGLLCETSLVVVVIYIRIIAVSCSMLHPQNALDLFSGHVFGSELQPPCFTLLATRIGRLLGKACGIVSSPVRWFRPLVSDRLWMAIEEVRLQVWVRKR